MIIKNKKLMIKLCKDFYHLNKMDELGLNSGLIGIFIFTIAIFCAVFYSIIPLILFIILFSILFIIEKNIYDIDNHLILNMHSELKKLDINSKEKEELMEDFYSEYNLSLFQGNKVIITLLPTYKKIMDMRFKNEIKIKKNEMENHNNYIYNVFYNLPKPVQDLININEFLVENFKETNNFKLLKNKFHSNIDHIKQNLLFDKDLKMNKNKFNYPTSNDYQKLVNHLLEYPEERIICLVYEKHNNPVLSYASFKDNYFTLGTIGICWFDTNNKEEFVRLCIKYNVKYIMPYAN